MVEKRDDGPRAEAMRQAAAGLLTPLGRGEIGGRGEKTPPRGSARPLAGPRGRSLPPSGGPLGGFLVTADWHCHAWLEGGEPVNGCNARISDFIRAIDFLLNYANDHSIDRAYQLGDVFHLKKNIPLDAYNALWERLYETRSRLDWRFIAGNHDREDDRYSSVTTLPFKSIGRVFIEPIVDEDIIYLPWLYDQEKCRKFLKETKGDFYMLLFHGELDGAEVGPSDYRLKSTMTTKIIQPERFEHVFAGHLHKRQSYYPGSLLPKDFGELEDDKGFLHVTPDGRVIPVRVPSPTFKVFRLSGKITDKVIDGIRHAIGGNFARIFTTQPLDPAFVKILENAEPRYLNLKLARELPGDLPRAVPEESESIPELLGTYIKEQGVPDELSQSYYEYGLGVLREP